MPGQPVPVPGEPAPVPGDPGSTPGEPVVPGEPASRSGGHGPPEFDVVILAGGHASRLGGADKPGLVIGNMTMAAAVTSAVAAAGARKVVLVGPPRPELAGLAATLPGGLTVTREDPPGSGPVPALRTGLAEVTAPWVAVLAADLPFLRAADVLELVAAAQGPDRDEKGPGAENRPAGAVLIDDQDAAQWLAGCWRTSRLRAALASYPGDRLRGVLAPLDPALLRVARDDAEPPPWLDCDTPAAVDAARIAAQRAAMAPRRAARHQDARRPDARRPGRASNPEQREATP